MSTKHTDGAPFGAQADTGNVERREWYTGYETGRGGFSCPTHCGHMYRQGWLVGSGTPSPGYNRSSVEHFGDSMEYDHIPREIEECETGK